MKHFTLAALCVVAGLCACSKRDPTDDQLVALLRAEAVAPSAPARIDAGTATCLRAWSGDVELSARLPASATTEESKADCRRRIEGWVADRTRNPAAFRFEDIDTPAVVRRVVVLQKSLQMAALDNSRREVPAGLVKTRTTDASAPVQPPGTPAGDVNLGAAGARLQEAETLCVKVQQTAGADGAKSNLVKFSRFCGNNLRTLRTTMENVARNGQQSKLDELAISADNLAGVARNLLGAPAQ